jgi:NitT/TauT family transport system substrate-binding protein
MAALDKGFYREAGLEVELLRGGPDTPPIEALEADQADICSAWLATALRKWAAGARIVNIGQTLPRSSILILAWKDRGIKTPRDLAGARVGLWGGDFDLPAKALFRTLDIRPQVFQTYTSPALFLKKGVDAVSATWYNEYHTILNSGVAPDDLTIMSLAEALPEFPEDGLYCAETFFDQRPAAAKAFLAATLKGWRWCFESQDEALDIVMNYANAAKTETNRAHQRWMLARMKDLMVGDGSGMGRGVLSKHGCDSVADLLKQTQLIWAAPEYEAFARGPR